MLEGSYGAQYTGCGPTIQGSSVGWGDLYGANLIDQWIDLGPAGSTYLADGYYAVQSTVNPPQGNSVPKLTETNYTNNVGRSYFGVQGGAITQYSASPLP
ncbi:MAG: hypothetical protein FJ315_05710 [SAR202 cluster bacterium]|nr:hypothetical protein [SAR202 cluster bacterium]